MKAPQTYFNKKFEEKEELRESHILWELDREKTYYRSAMERMNPQAIRNQVETEKMRRTNMLMSLNHNIMEKSTNLEVQSSKFSNSLKKLPTNFSNKKSPFKEGGYQIAKGHDRTASGFYNTSGMSSNGGASPIKLMSMTMPKGFVSPKNARKGGEMMNKTEIKEVVKSYFDKSGNTYLQPTMNTQSPLPPTSAGGYSMTNEFVVEVRAFNPSP